MFGRRKEERVWEAVHSEWKEACSHLKSLQQQAGIDVAIEKANQRLGGTKWRADKALDEERLIIFALENAEMRERIIRGYRNVYTLFIEDQNAETNKLRAELRDVGGRIRNSHTWGATTASGLTVFAAYYQFGMMGALVGIAIAMPVAFALVLDGQRQASERERSLQQELKEHLEFASELGSESPVFNAAEQESGEPGGERN